MTHRLEEVADRLSSQVASLRDAVNKQSGSNNVNTVRVQGMGSMWNGIAIGIALGAVIVATGWNVSKLAEMNVRSQQSEAYAKAVYMLAPRFAEAIDKELQRDKKIDQEAQDK
ncbi:hypothetical protein [Xanthomonas rydalmerensis]|uniref:Uncharacterized protein n=1 Tax=Xanthomonas rydalmerensis TaxID=3046274 RepID=A0ABZ0JM12_9XANT|nr:hypothetical protein [Xanthomonas sp. DM-2023]WOS40670.1 hypothetical protein QN243_20130 [Xanthomonas sp. DM-2023]WOS44854.1 hypothetical protein QN242_20130 [Xanthomonas sp. DM-2023]WOS49034.1 hypothetical protein QN240_20130 [Xanthomonas sp. DM-2023]WOS53214.1 hypothetical protein QN244_20135 [Xanthomonas sp. DM-2023]WOS57397.1 hypothetical protein QN245_20130 [Xanthomonas sp. DM-2023]